MTTIEKKMLAGVFAFLFMVGGCSYLLSQRIQQAGGLKGAAVSIGKTFKDIQREIDQYEPQAAE